jgi:hypothetical protein
MEWQYRAIATEAHERRVSMWLVAHICLSFGKCGACSGHITDLRAAGCNVSPRREACTVSPAVQAQHGTNRRKLGTCTRTFSRRVPEIPVSNVEKAAEYYVNTLGFHFDWGDEQGGIGGISQGECRLFLTNAAFRQYYGNAWQLTTGRLSGGPQLPADRKSTPTSGAVRRLNPCLAGRGSLSNETITNFLALSHAHPRG